MSFNFIKKRLIRKANSSNFARQIIAELLEFTKTDAGIRFIKQDGIVIRISYAYVSVCQGSYGSDGPDFYKCWDFKKLGYKAINSSTLFKGLVLSVHEQISNYFSSPYLVSIPTKAKSESPTEYFFRINYSVPKEKIQLKNW